MLMILFVLGLVLFKKEKKRGCCMFLILIDQWEMMSDLNMSRVKMSGFCFIFIVCVHVSHKTDKFRFWKLLKYFWLWCQIQICPVKHCLIWFKHRFLRSSLAISWEIRILNFIEIWFNIFQVNQSLLYFFLSHLYFLSLL